MSDDEMGGSGDEDCYYNDYYSDGHDPDVETLDKTLHDPEYFEFSCLTDTQVELFLNEMIEELSTAIQVSDWWWLSLISIATQRRYWTI